MKILAICDVLMPLTTGGAGRMAREIAVGLARRGDSVNVLTRAPLPGTPRIDSLDNGVEVSYYPRPGHAPFSAYRRIFDEVASGFSPDLIHVHQPLAAFLCRPQRLGAPIAYSFHSSWPEELKVKSSRWPVTARNVAARLLARIERQSIEQAAEVIVLSRFSRDVVQAAYGRAAKIIPGGVDKDRFRPTARTENRGAVSLGTLRNLVPRMGLEPLIDAMGQLPEHVRLDIGGEGPLRHSLQRRIDSQGLSGRVSLRGRIPEEQLPRFYNALDYFVLPTRALENFGLVILESLACGVPALGTRIGAIPELLEQFDPAWVIDRCDPEAIASRIRAAVVRPAPDRTALHQRVAEKYDWDVIVDQYRQVFRGLVDRGPVDACATTRLS